MSQPRAMYISIVLVSIIMGIMVAVQFKAINLTSGAMTSERDREIVSEIKRVNLESESLSEEIEDLKHKIKQLNQGQAEAMEALKGELKKARMGAGLVTVQGPGVEVVLDNPEFKGDLVAEELGSIQDQDLLSTVNELWGSGAEAVSINGQRIVATSEIRTAASFININTNRVVPPYQVLAIGEPEVLAENLLLPGGGLVEYFQKVGFLVTVQQHEELTIPAYGQR